MTQATALKPAICAFERTLITIEFSPNVHKEETEYSYEHPRFTFGDRVTIKHHLPELKFTVCALELIEAKTSSGRLINQPYWRYKVSNGEVSLWKSESALRFFQGEQSIGTCSECSYFNDYKEKSGRGRCNLFDCSARTFHEKTDDCVLNSQEDELNKPHSEYKVGSVVKIIDPVEDHTEWGVFEIIERKHNKHLYHSADSYLNGAEWYFRLASNENVSTTISPLLWIREDEICFSEQSHNICTKEIF